MSNIHERHEVKYALNHYVKVLLSYVKFDFYQLTKI